MASLSIRYWRPEGVTELIDIDEWHRCRNGFVEGMSQDEALEGYLDGEETAEILLYRRIYYA